MSEIDERLNYIRERVDVHAFHNARADLPYLLELVTDLRQQLTTHAAAASAACQEWDVKCQELEQQLARVTALVPEAELLQELAQVVEHEAWPLPDWPQHRARAMEQVQQLQELATRIRGWRGEQGQEAQDG